MPIKILEVSQGKDLKEWSGNDLNLRVQLLVPAKLSHFLTKNCILGQIKLSLLEKYLTKPPLTNAYLFSKVETVQDYQRRRIKWVIKISDESEFS